MKTFVLFLISMLFLSITQSHAQNEGAQEIGGIRAGYHIASMVENGSKPDSASRKESFYFGLYREQNISKYFYYGAGLEYFQNGLKYTGDSKRILHTISIPINAKFKIGPAFALGGAAANFKVAERIKIGDNSHEPSEENKSNWFDVPVFLGAGVTVLFITVEARYHWGLIEVRDGLHNRYFQLGAAISF